MIRHAAGLLAVLVAASGAPIEAGRPAADLPSDVSVERHHYSIGARIRPLLVFWIGRSGIGDAIVTKHLGPDEAAYSLLIGSDPDRAPRRINRWGYIDERIHGAEATLTGLMTESEEDSLEQAEANVRSQAAGERTFKVIRATVDRDVARSTVISLAAPAAYSFRHVDTVLNLARRESERVEGRSRVIPLPPGTRPGFLAGLAEVIHAHVGQWRASGRVQPGASLKYVYYGRIYELRATRTQPLPIVRVGAASYARVIDSDFEVKSLYDGELTTFSLTYGTEGRLAEIPVAASYQPRWWMQIELTLDETAGRTAADAAPARP